MPNSAILVEIGAILAAGYLRLSGRKALEVRERSEAACGRPVDAGESEVA
jgi:hypothetical protein